MPLIGQDLKSPLVCLSQHLSHDLHIGSGMLSVSCYVWVLTQVIMVLDLIIIN